MYLYAVHILYTPDQGKYRAWLQDHNDKHWDNPYLKEAEIEIQAPDEESAEQEAIEQLWDDEELHKCPESEVLETRIRQVSP